MAYDPADLKLPHWLLASLDWTIQLRLPIWRGWHVSMTRPGVLYASTMTGVVAAAFYSGNNLLYLCAAMLVNLSIAAFVQGIVVLLKVSDVSDCMPETSIVGGITVTRRTLSEKMAMPAMIRAVWQSDIETVTCMIRFAKEGSLRMRLHALRRGLFLFSSLRLFTEAPLGLWQLEHRMDTARWTWAVLPQAVPLSSLPAYGAPHDGEQGSHEGEEWRDLRGYYPGDAPSRIHWRKSAGSEWDAGRWMVKRFAQPQGVDTVLRVDLRGQIGPAFERLLGQAVNWIQQHPKGRLVLGQQVFNLGEENLQRSAWRAIASAQPEPNPPAGDGGMVLSMVQQQHAI